MRIACWARKSISIHKICNTYCFYTATMITRTCLNVTLHVNCRPLFLCTQNTPPEWCVAYFSKNEYNILLCTVKGGSCYSLKRALMSNTKLHLMRSGNTCRKDTFWFYVWLIVRVRVRFSCLRSDEQCQKQVEFHMLYLHNAASIQK